MTHSVQIFCRRAAVTAPTFSAGKPSKLQPSIRWGFAYSLKLLHQHQKNRPHRWGTKLWGNRPCYNFGKLVKHFRKVSHTLHQTRCKANGKKKIKESKDFPPTRQVGGGFHLTQLPSLNFPFSFISQYWQVTEVCGEQHFSKKITLAKKKCLAKKINLVLIS